jgi:hypothetical protein
MPLARPAAAVLGLLLLAACTSPEASRVRGGGRGADPGNRGSVVEMHAGSRPYHGTPRLLGQGVGLDDLGPARSAQLTRVPPPGATRAR